MTASSYGNSRPGRPRRKLNAILIYVLLFAVFLFISISLYRSRRDFYLNQVQSEYKLGHLEKAAAIADEWAGRRPNAPMAWLWKAKLGLATGNPAAASDALLKAESLGAPADQARLVRMIATAFAGRYAEAEPALRDAFNQPGRADPLLSEALARIYIESYDFPRAAIVLDRWKKESPTNAKTFLWSAEVDSRTGKSAEAIADYREALTREPNNPRALIGLADELRAAQQNDEAAKTYNLYLKSKPDDPRALFGSGCVAADAGDNEAAIKQFEKAIKLNPEMASAYFRLGGLQQRQGNLSEALKYLEKAREIDPFDLETRNSLAIVLNQSGRVQEAKTEAQTAKQLRTEMDTMLAAQARLVKAPKELASQLQIMRWMFRHGKPKEGIRWGEQILKDHPFEAETCQELADYYDKTGQPGLANSYRGMARPGP